MQPTRSMYARPPYPAPLRTDLRGSFAVTLTRGISRPPTLLYTGIAGYPSQHDDRRFAPEHADPVLLAPGSATLTTTLVCGYPNLIVDQLELIAPARGVSMTVASRAGDNAVAGGGRRRARQPASRAPSFRPRPGRADSKANAGRIVAAAGGNLR